MSDFVICPCCGQWLEIQNIGFYTYAFPMSLNMRDAVRDAVLNMNTNDFLNTLQTNFEKNFKFNSQATQCILNKEDKSV